MGSQGRSGRVGSFKREKGKMGRLHMRPRAAGATARAPSISTQGTYLPGGSQAIPQADAQAQSTSSPGAHTLTMAGELPFPLQAVWNSLRVLCPVPSGLAWLATARRWLPPLEPVTWSESTDVNQLLEAPSRQFCS